MPGENSSIQGVVKSIGLVFGDIGTGPIYALTAIFLLIPANPGDVMGILSLIFWTLTILVVVTEIDMQGNSGDTLLSRPDKYFQAAGNAHFPIPG